MFTKPFPVDDVSNSVYLQLTSSLLYVGESGLVYRGYIDTSLGYELVAVKTGKGIKMYIYMLRLSYLKT